MPSQQRGGASEGKGVGGAWILVRRNLQARTWIGGSRCQGGRQAAGKGRWAAVVLRLRGLS
eukprot:9389001-Lingulodinium_polyedra.AAC.1